MTEKRMYKIESLDSSVVQGVRRFFKDLMNSQAVDAVFGPMGKNNGSGIVMPGLVTDPEKLGAFVPFSPAFALNAARMVSRLSYEAAGRKTAVFMRPCEHSAFVELIKLKQGSRDELVLIGADCCGALSTKDYARYQANGVLDEDAFFEQVFGNGSGKAQPFEGELAGLPFSPACRTCGHPVPVNTDINLIIYGAEISDGILVQALTDKGQELLEGLELKAAELPANRNEKLDQIQKAQEEAALSMIQEVEEKTDTLDKLETYFDACINCYNCRNMCPVCYCKECVFNTDVFAHKPVQYFQWAQKKGQVKLPTDTLFYHLTRMAHMSHACVGCGQCSNACPSEIPVFDLFKGVARLSQAAFDYAPGRDDEELPPFAVFKEKEFEQVVGVAD